MKSLAAVSVLCALVFAGAGGAAPSKNIVLQLEDVVAIQGAKLACTYTKGKIHLKGKRLVGCIKLKGPGPAPSSYAPALAVDGTIAVLQYSANVKSTKLVFQRKLSSRSSGAKTVPAKVGDSLVLAGTQYGCGIARSQVVVTTCAKFSSGGAAPNSYGFSISEKYVVIFRFDAKRRPSAVFQKTH